METKQITRAQLVDMLNDIKGAKPVTIEFNTVPKMNVKDRVTKEPNQYLNDLTKYGRYNVILNFDYENSVNRQLTREDKQADFETQASWFEHVGDNRVIVERNMQLYVQCKLEKVLDQNYKRISNGLMVDENELTNFFATKSTSNNQGTDKKIIPLTIAVNNIIAVNHNKVRYEIIG